MPMTEERKDLTAWENRVNHAHKRAKRKGGKRKALTGADVWAARQERRERARFRQARRA